MTNPRLKIIVFSLLNRRGPSFLLLLLLFIHPLEIYPETLQDNRIGLLAKRGSEIDVQLWTATADYLTARLPGHRFHIVPLDFTEVHDAVREGRIDFILANSAMYVELERLHGVSRIATMINRNLPGQQSTTFGGVLFSRADREDIVQISDLRNRRFMAVEPQSFGGWIACWRELHGLGIDPLRFFASLEFGGTHDSVVYAVQSGAVDAGTVRTDTLERMAEDGSIRLDDFHILNEKVVPGFPFKLSTALYPEWPMAALKNTSVDLARQVTSALLAMDSEDPAAQASRTAGWTVPLNYQPVHNCLLDLRIGPYVDFGQFTLLDVIRQYWRLLILLLLAITAVIATSLYIMQLNRRLHLKMDEVDELNTTLEAKVVERTSQIKTLLNREHYLREIMETIAEVNSLLISSADLNSLLRKACRAMSAHSHYGYCWIGLLRDNLIDTVFTADESVRLPDAPPYDPFDLADPFAASSAASCITTNQTVVLVKGNQETTVTPWLDRANPAKFRAVIALPLRADRYTSPLGALCVYTTRETGFEQEEIAMLEELAGDIGFAISSFWQREKVSGLERERAENYEQTILSFADMIDQRDTYTAGHTERVAHYSTLLADALGLTEPQINLLQKAATLHDIGKIATPDSILLKPGKLSALDYELIKLHASAGHTILANIPMYKELSEIIRHHHERHDGMGYPDRLQGKDIPLLSRIITVADSFDAMTTNRIYKPRKTIDEALRELKMLSGSQFDPDLVAAGLNVLQKVTTPEFVDQLPKNQMEQRRFSYFFSDKLTGLYNEDYLQILLQNNQTLNKYHCLHNLHLKNLEQYNKKKGWEQGNVLLQKFASELQSRYPQALLFRAYGRDFVLITAHHFDLNADELVFSSLRETGVAVNASHFDLRENAKYYIEKLENFEIQCDLEAYH
ncbi:PhnD/SsuA/transferrin family substrate-binding protein [Desulfobulbus alkaliphilus]|uniref:PhnD/SsuA/transferrin family substrate-binding protein n=1 Tax=Desulfobulbus alkaliphilus TaxID=869814 RepID=UPI0019668C4F|nr:PhnD/SsuA/transferrin family substrate-binding protein [Desulfobulbus alkaliphilus]